MIERRAAKIWLGAAGALAGAVHGILLVRIIIPV
jgi:hypothetical protein